MKQQILRLPAEKLFEEELNALIKAETEPVPQGWRMSPRSVKTYICGGKVGKTKITPKYIGHERLVEIAISTLVTDRALLLIGEPGTAKSWLSEHLAAAINGNSGHYRGADTLFVELRNAYRERSERAGNAEKPRVHGYGNGNPRAC